MDHRKLEGQATIFAVLSVVAILIGTIVELVPTMTSDAARPEPIEGITPYTPLEVAGRDIYVREGCYNCHSQWVRPFRAETMRYGPWSRGGEYVYDRPFQLGSRRIGPDLMRVGGKYPDAWHYEHMRDPRSVSPSSVMPPYQWLVEWTWDPADVQASVNALATVGHPYSEQDIANVEQLCNDQADGIVTRLKEQGIETTRDKEIIALIAYLQRLGVQGKAAIAKREAGE